ncbi:MAG: aldehyde dehydrogenase family protein [Myxococcota bacterium]|nr:aldehyde dehydrogenase family protein [Myxococcota bacterium]
MDLASRIKYLEAVFEGTFAVADDQVDAAVEAKGVVPGSAMAAEDYLAGPVVQGRTIRLLLDSLRQLRDRGRVEIKPKQIRDVGPDQIAVQVIPHEFTDTLLLTGFEAEIWQAQGISRQNLSDHMAEFYRQDHSGQSGRVALVLGAGNVASIGPLDVIHKLFVEGQVCLLKMNPVNEYLGPFIERAFKDLIDGGFMRLAYGGGDVGAYLCEHDCVDEIHITGSNFTHDAIVFGTGEEGQRRKAANQPKNHKRITSELGNVSPVIVVPGSWNQSELRFHAENIATQMTNNGGFNCNAAKVLIFHEDWNQRTEFMDMLKSVLAKLPSRPAYYPGAHERYDKFVDGHDQAVSIGKRTADTLPWTLIPNCSSEDTNEICFVEESFCGITAQTTLPGHDAADFLKTAVDFCNERLWGTLNACIIVHPTTEKRIESEINRAIKELRYGSVAINHWPGLCYGMGATAWGAYPGHTLDDIQSGIGFVHNTNLFDKPVKTVLRGPFKVFPKPPWFVTHKRSLAVARRMASMEKKPSLAKVPGIAWNAIKGS